MKVDIEQDTPEWHEFRLNHLGASDSTIIMGASPWSSPYKLWCQKLQLEPEPEMNDAMRRGKELEAEARRLFIEFSGIHVEPAVFESDTIRFMSASLDGVREDHKMAIEIKCPGREDHALAVKNEIPEKYKWQLLHQMLVLNIDSIFYVSYNPREHTPFVAFLVDKEFLFSEQDICLLLHKEAEFWDCVKTLKAPEYTDKDFVDMSQNREWIETSARYFEIKKDIEQLEDALELYKFHLITLSQGKNCIGNRAKLQKIVRKGAVDYTKIPELKKVDLEKYRKDPIVSWRIDSL